MPKTRIITSKNLDAGTVIPQCLDNQFLPDAVFYDMQKRKVDYSDSSIKNAREKATKSVTWRTGNFHDARKRKKYGRLQ